MRENIIDFEIAHMIANENQLLAEEQWLVDVLKKIQTQRNSLQIERLHLESLKSQLLCNKTSETAETSEDVPAVSMMQQIPSMKVDLDTPIVKDDEVCNGEELNLAVSSHRIQSERDMEMEEYEDEDTEDDDYTIDMNMFMNGGHNSSSDK